MNKKVLFACTLAAVVIVGGVTAIGAKELGICSFMYSKASKQVYGQERVKSSINAFVVNDNQNMQEITTQLEPNNYPVMVVQKGIPAKWTVVATKQTLNACNNEIIIPELGISAPLKVGQNVIEFTPDESGVINYSCWMGMISSAFVVVDDLENYNVADVEAQISTLPQSGGGFCGTSVAFGGKNIISSGGCCGVGN